MAPELEVIDLCEDRVRHKRSKSESHQGPATPRRPGSEIHGHRRGIWDPQNHTGLTEDGVPSDRFRQTVQDKKAHPVPLNKRLQLRSHSADISETRSTMENTSMSSVLSGDENLVSKAQFEQLQDADALSKQELKLERDAHSDTKAKLQSVTTALEIAEKKLREMTRTHFVSVSLHKDAQQRLKKEHEQQVQDSKSQHDHPYQSAVFSRDEALRASSIELESISKKNQESLKKVKKEVDAANRERDEAFKVCKALKSQLATVTKEKQDHALRMKEKLDAKIGELDATQEEFAADRDYAKSIISKLEEDMQEAGEEHEASKALHETQKLLNKALETKNKQLEKRSSEAKDKIKKLQAVHKSEQSQLSDQIAKLEARKKTIRAQKEKLQNDFDSNVAQHNEDMNDLLQQVRESQGLSQRYNFRVSDEEIIDEWQNLRHKIRQFVDQYTRAIQMPEPLPMKGMWTVLSPLISEFLASPWIFMFAFEAYLWEWMSLNVFDPYSLVWAGELGRTFNELSWRVEDRIRDPDDELTSEYHGWRATSSNLLSRVDQRGPHNLSYHGSLVVLVQDLQALLGPEFIRDDAYRDLTEIVHHARAFEITRRKVKSKIEVCFGACNDAGIVQRYNMPVDDSLMRKRTPRVKADLADSNPDPGPLVKLIVSPAIVRWGNSNGVDYDRKTCLVKMDVLVSRLPDIVPQRPSEPVPAAGGGQLGQRSNTADGRRCSAKSNNTSGKQVDNTDSSTFSNQNTQYAQAPKIRTEMHKETGHSTLPPPSGQSARHDQVFPPNRNSGRTLRPRNAAREGTNKRRLSDFEQKYQPDELNGGPDDYKNTCDSKPVSSKKRKSGGGGNGGR